MMYLGPLGRMVGIKCPTSQRVSHAGRYSFRTTLGGAVKAQVGPVGRRTWDVGLGRLTTPSDVGTLMDFANGVWGPGPFWFVPADAPVVNLLSPDAASCDPARLELGGGVELLGTPPMDLGDDGVAARSVWTDGSGRVTMGTPVPVLQGSTVTGSAWVIGSSGIRLSFLNAAGEQVHTQNSGPPSSATAQRIAVTVNVPEQAVAVQIMTLEGVTQAARPALTWTTQPYEWGDGQGCPQAIVHNTQRDVVKAWDHPNTGRWSDITFTVQEVG